MDKVIIDGVDVSECSNFKFGTCSERLCKLNVNENCYYKQLQREKAENERIKRDFLKQNQWLQDQKKEIDELKTENERLKEKHKKLTCKILEVSALNDTLIQKCKEEDCEQLKKYRQALQEIRNIAEKMYNTNDEDIERDLHIELQAKINEVIGAE